jgi:hypothetical protein
VCVCVCVCVCLIVCDLETSIMRRPGPELGCSATEKKGERRMGAIINLRIIYKKVDTTELHFSVELRR